MNETWRQALEQRLAEWRDAGLERSLRVFEGSGVRLKLDGREILSFASNDYLGLASDPRLIDAASRAMKSAGAGSTASALIVGHKSEHAALESEL
ncbi:MAG TPA: 8-amino-7-oxononanoate synthase, partial [Planctomycetota bacterium]|nr:8-amino-7-oxononanoate synthase [Planctomycetota bacterium]